MYIRKILVFLGGKFLKLLLPPSPGVIGGKVFPGGQKIRGKNKNVWHVLN